MRNVMTAAAGLAIFFGTACSSSTTPPDDTNGSGPGGAGTTTGTKGTGTTTGTGIGGGGTTGKVKLLDGQACDGNLTCQSGVCGLAGTGHCCTTRCKTDDAACAATADCDNSGACVYPPAGGPCNSSCQYGLFTSSLCDGNGACSAQTPVACPDNLACNNSGTACEGTCNPANGTSDCSLGWWCNAGTCTPQVQLGGCVSNSECQSNVCGVTGVGHCCTQTACLDIAAPCGTLDCDGATGACTFPDTTVSCSKGSVSCSGDNQVDPNTTCDGVGACVQPIQTNCSPYACEEANGGCVTSCTSIADCAKDFYCSGNVCIPQNAIGPCTENDACISFQCGGNGSGNCCFSPCGNTDPACGITGCDVNDGSCQYPDKTNVCGSVLESCTAGIQQNPSVCDGLGNCPAPGTTNCSPFICGATSCLTSCSSNSDCATGDACDTGHSICCPAILSGDTMNVDNSSGDDSAACCGIPGYTECKTISMAMSKIDAAQASGVTLNAYIGGAGNGGDWVFTGTGPYYCGPCYPQYAGGEPVPITLGWGVTLNAPGVNFAPNWYNLGYGCDPGSYNNCFTEGHEIIDVAQYSASDTTGYASIVGSDSNGAGPVQIGLSSQNHVYDTMYVAAVQVESGQHLYIANANASTYYYARYYYSPYTGSAINVAAGGSLTVGTDKSGANTGTVTLGSTSTNNSQDWGYIGLTCQTDGVSQGCTVDDVAQDGGASSLVIAGMAFGPDIDAEDFANITLVGNPSIGDAPSVAGFLKCSSKIEGQYNGSFYNNDIGNQMIWLNGQVTMDFENGTVQCLDGDAFFLNASPNGNGTPSLTLKNSTIQNTEGAIYASAGSATVSGSTLIYNAFNVFADTDGTNQATMDLSGGTSKTTNTIACTSREESRWYSSYYSNASYYNLLPSTSVLNTTDNNIDADNVAWETKGPDEFSCDSALDSCTCEIAACTNGGADDDMDAVYTGNGTISTNNNTQTTYTCTAPVLCGGTQICSSTQICCHYPWSTTYNFCYPTSSCPNGSYYYQSYD